MADIRVDRYEVNCAGTSGTIAITDVGALSSAFLRLVGSTKQDSAGPVGSASNTDPNDVGVRLELTATDEVTFTKQTSNTVKVMFEVWVYTGSPSGDYEFISRQRGTVTVSGTSNTAAISGITNRNDCVPLYTGFTTAENSRSDFEQAVFACHLNDSSQIVFSRNNSGTTQVCAYDVVEFTGSAWSVGCGRSAAHDDNGTHFTGGEVVTMNTDSDGVGGSTFDVSDWSTAMILQGTMEGDTSETGISDTMIYVLPGPTSSELRFTLDNTGSRNDGVAYAYVIQCDDLAVSRATSNVTEGNNSYGTNLAAPSGYSYSTPLSEMSLEWFPGTNGEGTAHLRGALHAQIIDTGSAYQVRHWIHRSGNDVAAAYAFADLSGLVSVSGVTGDLDATDSGPDTASVTGGVIVGGDLAATDSTDAADFAGAVVISGALSATDATDSAEITGGVQVSGDLAAAETGADAADIEGGLVVAGIIAATDSPDSATFSGAVTIQGVLTATDTGDTVAFSGTVQSGVSGALAVTGPSDSADISGAVVISGQLSATDATDTASASGSVFIAGALSATDETDSAAIEGGPVITGQLLTAEQGEDSATITGKLVVTAVLDATETSADTASFLSVIGEAGVVDYTFQVVTVEYGVQVASREYTIATASLENSIAVPSKQYGATLPSALYSVNVSGINYEVSV
jgi:hypothetical protein